jgi:hypothetical protein
LDLKEKEKAHKRKLEADELDRKKTADMIASLSSIVTHKDVNTEALSILGGVFNQVYKPSS